MPALWYLGVIVRHGAFLRPYAPSAEHRVNAFMPSCWEVNEQFGAMFCAMFCAMF